VAYVAAITEGQLTTDSLSVTPTLPPHAANDLLIVWWSKDDGAGGTPTISGGSWSETETTTKGGDNGLVGTTGNNSARGGYLWLVAASSNETPPTITSSDADSWCWACATVKGAPATSPIDVAGSAQTDATEPYDATGVTTGTADCLVFYSGAVDGGVSMTAFPGLMNMSNRDSGNDALCVAWMYKRTAGATGSKRFYATGTADDTVFFCIAVKDGSSGTQIDGYTDATIGTLITPNKGLTVLTNELNTPTNMTGYEVLPAASRRAADTVYQYDASPVTYTDYTTAASNSTTGDVVPFPATEATGDALMIGDDAQFFGIFFDRTTTTNGVAGVVAWEYYATGGTWKALPNVYDGTTGFTTAGSATVGWSRSIAADWTSQTINSVTRYWVRARCTTVYTTNPTITQIFVGDAAAIYDALAAIGDSGVNPYEGRLASSPGQTGCVHSGGFFRWAAATDLSAATYLLTSFLFGHPRDSIDAGESINGGVHFTLADTNATLRIRGWCVGSLDSYAQPSKWNPVGVALSYGGRFFDEASWSNTSVRSQLMAPSCQYGSTVAGWGHILSAGKLLLSGGGSSLPISYEKTVAISKSFPVIMQDANIWYLPIKIGGGDKVVLDWSLFSASFPTEYDTDNYARNWRVSNSTVGMGIEIDARSGDTCKLRLGTISARSYWKFDVLATASAAATYDFTGLTLVGGTVTLRAVHTWSGMSFINCPTFTTNAAVIQSCSFTNTKATCASPASAGNISNCTFTSGGTGYAIEIGGTAADVTLTGITFTGYAASSGSTGNEAIYVNIATGSMSISIAGGSTPSIRTAGATVTVISSATLTITGLVTGSDVVVYSAGTTTVLDDAQENGTSSWGYTYSVADAGDFVDIGVFKTGYRPYYIRALELPATSSSVPVAQAVDLYYIA
jgi:hypothetical protein